MSTLTATLEAWHCDVAGAMRRFLNDESLFKMCFSQMMDDENFEALGTALQANDTTASFECAHALKGIIANMGITPLYDVVVTIVEPLRAKTVQPDTLLPEYEKLMALRAELTALTAGC